MKIDPARSVAWLDDRVAVIDQLNALAYLLDHREWDRFDSVMTTDVEAYGDAGLDNVVAGIRRYLGGCGPSQHLLGNYQVEVDGDSARSITKARVFHQGLGERSAQTYECFGEYHDRWTRTPAGWRMTHRRFDVTIQLGDFDVLQPG